MPLKQITHGSSDYKKMVDLRAMMLRTPLGLTFTKTELDNEKDDLLIAAFDEDEMLGCCILTKEDEQTLRLRQMAVKDNLQGKGIGAAIILFGENLARDKGYNKITMHARNTAIGFYEKFGYKVIGEEFVEVQLLHHTMQKVL